MAAKEEKNQGAAGTADQKINDQKMRELENDQHWLEEQKKMAAEGSGRSARQQKLARRTSPNSPTSIASPTSGGTVLSADSDDPLGAAEAFKVRNQAPMPAFVLLEPPNEPEKHKLAVRRLIVRAALVKNDNEVEAFKLLLDGLAQRKSVMQLSWAQARVSVEADEGLLRAPEDESIQGH